MPYSCHCKKIQHTMHSILLCVLLRLYLFLSHGVFSASPYVIDVCFNCHDVDNMLCNSMLHNIRSSQWHFLCTDGSEPSPTRSSWQSSGGTALSPSRCLRSLRWVPIPLGLGFAYLAYLRSLRRRQPGATQPVASDLQVGLLISLENLPCCPFLQSRWCRLYPVSTAKR